MHPDENQNKIEDITELADSISKISKNLSSIKIYDGDLYKSISETLSDVICQESDLSQSPTIVSSDSSNSQIDLNNNAHTWTTTTTPSGH